MKSLGDFLEVDLTVDNEVSPEFEISKILMEHYRKTVLFNRVKGSRLRVAGNIITSRDRMCSALCTTREKFVMKVTESLKSPLEAEDVNKTPWQKEIKSLRELPILRHFERDAGAYITSGVVFARDEEHGRNASIHRMLVIDDNHIAIRLVERHLHAFYTNKEEKNEALEIAIAIGLHPSVLFASSYSFNSFEDELALAGALAGEPVTLAKCKSVDLRVPSEAEIVIEGKILPGERTEEGPFTDITGTYDIVRKQPVIEVTKISVKRDAIYPALVPSSVEHRLLMGMPREPSIYHEVSKVADVKNVVLSEGGCSWLHGFVSIKKRSEDEPEEAIEAAFKGHRSMKHVVIVDDDIDIFSPEEVEFAIATRFQAHRDAHIFRNVKGSSLDPSAERSAITTKIGIDATKPLGKEEEYEKARIPEVNK